MSKIVLTATDPASPEILGFLGENEAIHNIPRADLDDDSIRFLTVRDGGELVFALSWSVVKRGTKTDIEIGAVNGGGAKNMKWIEPLVKTLDQIAEVAGADRVIVPVTRPALQLTLEKLGYIPLPIKMMMKAA